MPDTGFSIKVDGATEVAHALDQLADEVEEPRIALATISAEMAHVAAAFAPKLTGTLGGSIHAAPEKDTAAAATSLIYAGPINGGWPERNIKASLFMERAQTATVPLAEKQLQQDIDLTIRRKGLA